MNQVSTVKIIGYSPEIKKLCTAAARISTTKGTALEVFEKVGSEDVGLIEKVMKFGHVSFIEHAHFSIAFQNVSAFVEQFMIEFRLASFTIKSRRYVDFSGMGYVKPVFKLKNHDLVKEVDRAYRSHMDYLFREYQYFLSQGVSKEDARFVLPYSYKSNFYCSVNARELIHIIYSCKFGRGKRFTELYEIGDKLLAQAKEISPEIFKFIEIIEGGEEDKEQRLSQVLGANAHRSKDTAFIELLRYTDNPEDLVLVSAISNHLGCSMEEARSERYRSKYKEIFDIVCMDKRRRELEQICFTFRLNNLSLAALTHVVRHRMQSVVVPSFTEMTCDRYVLPESFKVNKILLERYEEAFKVNDEFVKSMLGAGLCKEDLVYLCLSGHLVSIITTMNARELYHFVQLRACNRAQWEVRGFAIEMLRELRRVAPNIFGRLGPNCFLKGKCTEGALSCGKVEDVRQLFFSL